MLAELTANGYLVRTRHRNNDGQFRWESIVYEEPIDQRTVDGSVEASSEDSAENPTTTGPQLEKPSAVQPPMVHAPIVRTESGSTESERIEDQLPEREGALVGRFSGLSKEFCLDDELREFAKACGCDADDEFRAFRNYCESTKKKYGDYRAAFMSWIEKTARFGFAVHVQSNDQSAESPREKCNLKKSLCKHVCHHGGCSTLPATECNHAPSIE